MSSSSGSDVELGEKPRSDMKKYRGPCACLLAIMTAGTAGGIGMAKLSGNSSSEVAGGTNEKLSVPTGPLAEPTGPSNVITGSEWFSKPCTKNPNMHDCNDEKGGAACCCDKGFKPDAKGNCEKWEMQTCSQAEEPILGSEMFSSCTKFPGMHDCKNALGKGACCCDGGFKADSMGNCEVCDESSFAIMGSELFPKECSSYPNMHGCKNSAGRSACCCNLGHKANLKGDCEPFSEGFCDESAKPITGSEVFSKPCDTSANMHDCKTQLGLDACCCDKGFVSTMTGSCIDCLKDMAANAVSSEVCDKSTEVIPHSDQWKHACDTNPHMHSCDGGCCCDKGFSADLLGNCNNCLANMAAESAVSAAGEAAKNTDWKSVLNSMAASKS
eukprot:TRINITY_DN6918_c0_g1_i1.p1 TRINITY_DN6918_c0_g1~~TRINITY_DN6918_c0_g1_i1.p1  ORF type:complete len:385 (-),score=66.04 TRINITY_DN6918_c0_g1_i1:186-1340(-)